MEYLHLFKEAEDDVVISLSPSHNWLKSKVDGSYNTSDGQRVRCNYHVYKGMHDDYSAKTIFLHEAKALIANGYHKYTILGM